MPLRSMQHATVIAQEELCPGIFSLWLAAPQVAAEASAGQFVSLYSHSDSRMLPRPISLCEIDRENGSIRLVYRVAGAGTEDFSQMKAGDTIDVMGPLGNGFPLSVCKNDTRVLLIGGGIGIPPMLETAKALEGRAAIAAGYRDTLFLQKELEQAGRLAVATEDGSAGARGTVLDAIRKNGIEADVIFACGPKPMLKAVREYARQHGIACWLSLEERMACGIGACLACVTRTTETDEHSRVKNARICKEGPVFRAEDIEL